MTQQLYLVFSERPAHIGEREYHEWYAVHAQENIESPGFVSAQRYVARELRKNDETGVECHLAVYTFEGPMEAWRADLAARSARGERTMPDWHREIGFRSWACEPAGATLLPTRC